MPNERRTDRVAEAVREEVAKELAEGVKDPRVTGLVTVTGVEMSRDLAHATVYVSVMGGDAAAREATLAGLQAVAGGMRGRIARSLHLRVAPALVFREDESVARAARIESLLASVRPRRDAAPGDAAPGDEAPGDEH